jgi:uncharacterized repeat protein (TIGR03803 family)
MELRKLVCDCIIPKTMTFKQVTLVTGLMTVSAVVAQQQPSSPGFRSLYNFTGAGGDGRTPEVGLAIGSGSAGQPVFYGTTLNGGDLDLGTVFSLTPPTIPGGAWMEAVLLSFNGRNGGSPAAGVVIGNDGVLYGTTFQGGVVYALTPPTIAGGAWTERVLHRFINNGQDGYDPVGALAIGSGGILYGTTLYGGTSSACGTTGCGTVFSLTPPTTPGGAWTETILHSFNGAPNDGALPFGGVVIAGAVLYGTTNLGGSVLCRAGGGFGCGTVFSLTPPASPGGAWTETVFHNFAGGNSDGAIPYRRVAIGAGSVLYGTTHTGGNGSCIDPGASIIGCGTVYSLKPPASPGGAWTEAVLHHFAGSPGDGALPYSPLTIGGGEILYGTTYGGGNLSPCTATMGCGTVFSLQPPTSAGGGWTERVLHNFAGYTIGGANPHGGVTMRDGVLYGTTEYGGEGGGACVGSTPGGCGTVFALRR